MSSGEEDTVLFDTDVLIWVQRGNEKAAKLISDEASRKISIQTYTELFQCARSKKEHQVVRNFLQDFAFSVLPLTENIGHRAAIYIEEYSLSSGLRSGDALIAATAIENNLVLSTGNAKHFKSVKDLQIKIFKP